MKTFEKNSALTKALLGGASLLAFTTVSGTASAAVIDDTALASPPVAVQGADTLDAATVTGATTGDIQFDAANGDVALSVDITGTGTVDLGAISISGADNALDTSDLMIGGGTDATNVIINGAIVGDSAYAVDSDLDITLDAVDGASSLSLYGAVDAATDIVLSSSDLGSATLVIGDGTTPVVNAATIDMGAGVNTNSVLTLAAGAEYSGMLEFASAGADSVVVNLGEGSVFSGTTSMLSPVADLDVNVTGNATIGDDGNKFTTTYATDSDLSIASGVTLTLVGDSLTSVAVKDLTFTDATSGLTLSGTENTATFDTVTGSGVITYAGTDSVLTLGSDLGTSTAAATVTVNSASSGELAATGTSDVTFYANASVGSTGDLALVSDTDAAITFMGDVTGTGTLTVAANDATELTTVTGNVGTSTVSMAAAEFETDTDFNGDIYASTIEVGLNGLNDAAVTLSGNATGNVEFQTSLSSLTFDGTTAQTVTGNLSGIAAASDGAVTVSNTAGVTVTGSMTVSSLTVGAGASLSVGSDLNTANAISLTDTSVLTLGSSIADGQTIFTTTDVTVSGSTSDTNTVVINVDEDLGDATVVLFSGGVNSDDVTEYSVTDTTFYTYDLSQTVADTDLTLTGTKKTTSEIASGVGISAQEAVALDTIYTVYTGLASPTADEVALATAISNALATGGATAKNAAEQLAPQSDTLGAGTAAVMGAGAQSIGTTSVRLASLRTGAQYAGLENGETGFAAGDAAMASAVWAKTFGNWISQDAADGVAGYDADTYGVAIGADKEVMDGVRVGAAISYANTDVDGDGAGNSQLDIDSYQLTVYGDYTADKYYVEGMVGFAFNTTDTERTLLTNRLTGDYDSQQYMASIGAGMPIWLEGNTYVTPTVGLAYTHVTSDSYTETGVGGVNMDPDDVDSLVASVGAKVHTSMDYYSGRLVPSAKVGVSYDLIGDEAQATAAYTAGGAAFAVEGSDVEELAGTVGLGLTYEQDAWSVGMNYTGEFKSDYQGHSAVLEARFKF